ncbi:hypothetical protein C7974DRAFT_50364 [Boeremia exigua]|uniref:uncharacterized protein n=1 Tax=Boeremia exigua TaxID=749465 RepID=UPI001E8E4F54|nr:uncharacterized protein C7974DRAFT_50364 [Boeremia exigua]KAH6616693.1 hypothetical protein C7974DRAFT_50364 [Boeremia exigua]
MPPHRTSNVQGRQKACTECVKAKRRCDVERPRCARCSQHSLLCTYPRPHDSLLASSGVGVTQSVAITTAMTPLQDAGATISTFDHEALGFPAALNEHLLDFDIPIDVIPENPLDQPSDTCPGEGHHIAIHGLLSPTKPMAWPWTNIAPSSRSRVDYAIEQIKLAPHMMVANNSTLWCHAMFYDEDMPRSMQDAHAACALYIARNDGNADYGFRHISSRVAELVETPVPTTSTAIIARAHALLLYQAMLVFGNDVRFFDHSVAVLHELEQVGCLLLNMSAQQTDSFDPLPLYPSATAHTAWKSYIFRETLRRTILSLYQFVTICGMLFGRLGHCAPTLSPGNRVMVSAHLWGAETAFDFAKAWNKERHFLVHDLDFTDLLENGRPDDIDDFAKTMLVGLQGIDEIRGWFYTKGGTL